MSNCLEDTGHSVAAFFDWRLWPLLRPMVEQVGANCRVLDEMMSGD